MPNNVTNKIIFDSSRADEIFSAVCPSGKLDFETLIPCPLNVYLGDTGAEEEKDFPRNWNSWNRENWGTKWNCYNCSSGIENGKAYITFDTAWSVPYPVIVAFANKFNLEFEHRYYDEGGCFWGIENWSSYGKDDKRAFRIFKKKNQPEDQGTLCLELKGYPIEPESLPLPPSSEVG